MDSGSWICEDLYACTCDTLVAEYVWHPIGCTVSLLSVETAFGNLVSRMQCIGDKNVRYCTGARTDRLSELKVFDRFSIKSIVAWPTGRHIRSRIGPLNAHLPMHRSTVESSELSIELHFRLSETQPQLLSIWG